MPTLRIERTNEYNNRFRDYAIYIDGKKIGTVANGEVKDFELLSGEHNLFCKIDWCTSPQKKFTLDANDTVVFKIGGFKYGKWIMPIALLLSSLLYIPRVLGQNYKYALYILIPVPILLIYYVTIGRKKYLTLSEI